MSLDKTDLERKYLEMESGESIKTEVNPQLVDVKRLVDTFRNDEFTGVISLSNENNYGCLTLNKGEIAGFWYSGENEKVEEPRDFFRMDVEEDIEIHIFQRDAPQADPTIEEGIEPKKSHVEPDYEEILDVVADSFSGFTGRSSFFNTLAEKFEEVEGIRVRGQGLVIEDDADVPDVYDHESEYIFQLLYEAIEEESEETPIDQVIDKIESQMKDIKGGEEFLEIAVVV